MSTIVIVPRDVYRRHARQACSSALDAGYLVHRVPGGIRAGYVQIEFVTMLQRMEPLALEAFEIEVDNILDTASEDGTAPSRSHSPFPGLGPKHP